MLDSASLAAHRFALTRTVRNLARRNGSRRPLVYLSVRGLRQRYLYLLAHSFIRAGFFVALDLPPTRKTYWATDPYARYVFDEPGLKAVSGPPADRRGAILCLDHDQVDAGGWSRVVRLDYDILAGLSLAESPGTVIAPYWMHPNAYRTGLDGQAEDWRQARRSVRLFFAGNLSHATYSHRGPLNDGMLRRVEIAQLVMERFAGRATLVHSPGELTRILDAPRGREIVLFDGAQGRLGREEWFPALSRCEFFLALPGVVMPMSHNLVEAMALGCIPVCNYPHWLSPRLRHGTDCLAFDDEASLARAVEAALGADAATIARMRQAAAAYYDRSLRPETLAGRILAAPGREVRVFLNAEEVSEMAAQRTRAGDNPGAREG